MKNKWKQKDKMELKLIQQINKFNKACCNMTEYLTAFDFLPPMGDGAKEQAIKEWNSCIQKVTSHLENIKNIQTLIIINGGWEDEDN